MMVMKTVRCLLFSMGALLAALTFNSCSDDDTYSLDNRWLSIATARPLDDNSFYLTLDDSTSLWPGAPLYIHYQPERPQRVQINFTILGDAFQGFDHIVKLNQIDTILTKSIAENLGTQNDAVYGKDPVQITSLWVGDGFLNVEFKAYMSGNVKHFVNLIRTGTASDPYRLEFRHNAYNDKSSYLRYGLVAFDLSSLPGTDGKNETLLIDVQTFDGVQTFKKTYNK
jgi:hypothetical protein